MIDMRSLIFACQFRRPNKCVFLCFILLVWVHEEMRRTQRGFIEAVLDQAPPPPSTSKSPTLPSQPPPHLLHPSPYPPTPVILLSLFLLLISSLLSLLCFPLFGRKRHFPELPSLFSSIHKRSSPALRCHLCSSLSQETGPQTRLTVHLGKALLPRLFVRLCVPCSIKIRSLLGPPELPQRFGNKTQLELIRATVDANFLLDACLR